KKVLQADGWTLAADGVFTKGRQRLDLELNTVTGNSRRETVEQLVIEQARKAGIGLHVKNFDTGTLFGTVLPHLGHTVAIYAQATGADPSVTDIFSCDSIPSQANGFQGRNTSAWCNREATKLMKDSDSTVDLNRRIDQV